MQIKVNGKVVSSKSTCKLVSIENKLRTEVKISQNKQWISYSNINIRIKLAQYHLRS